MHILKIKTIMGIALAMALAVAFSPTAKATIVCSNWKSGNSSGDDVYKCNFNTGSTGGSYDNSYKCYDKSYRGYCLLNYTGGESYQGECTIEFKCSDGKTYTCDLNNWDGKEAIKCEYIPRNCEEIRVRCPKTTSVPEPATVLSASLLLIPLGVSAARILRKNKVKVSI